MKTHEGGSMASMIFFALGFVAFIAGAVLYLVKEDQFSKKWAERTGEIAATNEQLAKKWEDATAQVQAVVAEHETVKAQLEEHKTQLSKIEYAIQKPPTGIQMPSTINFTVVERRRVVNEQPKPAEKLNGAHPLPAPQPDPATQKVIKKIKKQMKDLSQ